MIVPGHSPRNRTRLTACFPVSMNDSRKKQRLVPMALVALGILIGILRLAGPEKDLYPVEGDSAKYDTIARGFSELYSHPIDGLRLWLGRSATPADLQRYGFDSWVLQHSPAYTALLGLFYAASRRRCRGGQVRDGADLRFRRASPLSSGPRYLWPLGGASGRPDLPPVAGPLVLRFRGPDRAPDGVGGIAGGLRNAPHIGIPATPPLDSRRSRDRSLRAHEDAPAIRRHSLDRPRSV